MRATPARGVRSAHRRASTSRTSRSRPRVRTSRTPRCRRRSTTRPRASTRLTTETGAGQWGTALSFACRAVRPRLQGVHGARRAYEQKPYRKIMMETWGGEVVPSPVDDPSQPGSLGLAIRDAVRDAATGTTRTTRSDRCSTTCCCTRRSSGSRRKEQLALAGETRPDVVIAVVRRRVEPRRDRAAVHDRRRRCGSSRSSRRRARRSPRVGSSTTSATPSGMTPLLPMYTLGHEFMPPTIHAGGLRYHGDSPIISQPGEERPHGGDGLPAGQDVRGGGQFAEHRGQAAGARDRPRDPGRDRRGTRVPRRRARSG